MTDRLDERLLEALASPEPFAATVEFARSLKAEGRSQVAIFRLFSKLQVQLSGDDPRYDPLVDTMDLIWGGAWAKGHDLFPEVLTQERLRNES